MRKPSITGENSGQEEFVGDPVMQEEGTQPIINKGRDIDLGESDFAEDAIPLKEAHQADHADSEPAESSEQIAGGVKAEWIFEDANTPEFKHTEHRIVRLKEKSDVAKTNKWLLGIGLEVAGLVGLFFYAGLTYRQFQAANLQTELLSAQVNLMRKQLDTTDRAWIQITGVHAAEDFSFGRSRVGGVDDGDVSAGLLVTVKNIGHSVARDVSIRGRMIFRDDEMRKQSSLVCFDEMPSASLPPITLFPDQQIDLPLTDEVPVPTDAEHGLRSRGGGERKFISPHFVGCVSYLLTGAETLRHTGFAFDLWNDLPHPGQKLPDLQTNVIEIGISVPRNRLKIDGESTIDVN